MCYYVWSAVSRVNMVCQMCYVLLCLVSCVKSKYGLSDVLYVLLCLVSCVKSIYGVSDVLCVIMFGQLCQE